MLLRLLALARAPLELGEAEFAVGDEGAHAERVRQRERISVAHIGFLDLGQVAFGRDPP